MYLGGRQDCTTRTGTVLHFEIGAVIDGKVNLIWSRGEASEWGESDQIVGPTDGSSSRFIRLTIDCSVCLFLSAGRSPPCNRDMIGNYNNYTNSVSFRRNFKKL